MMKYISILLLFNLFIVHSHAQDLPWAGLPQKKQAFNNELEEVPIFLVMDTIHKERNKETLNETINFFYDSNVDLIGFGYKDAAGQPYGVWKYYEKKNNKLHLNCEGYYKLLTANSLVVNPDIIKKFPVSNSASVKENFIKSLSDRLFFTGEWRFYKDDLLDKIIQLDDKVQLPYHLTVDLVTQSNKVQYGGVVDQLNILMPANRLSGNMAMYIHFSALGFIESIYSENIRLKFDPSGKPLIEPLPDL